jgi:aquaporin Z
MSNLKEPASFSPTQALTLHWPEYLIEGWALGTFMVSASIFTTLLVHPGSPLAHLLVSPTLRRVLIGIAMGATAVGLIYSPWGQRSGAHMNPAVTLAFLSLRRISPINALCYCVAQCIGGWLGVVVAWAILGHAFADAQISFIVTVPGSEGAAVAFVAETVISFAMMFVILSVSNSARWSRYTGWAAGALIVAYVIFESPLSGFSMNPARTLASALPAHIWTGWWIYLCGPLLGMLAAAQLFHALTPWVERRHHTAKIVPVYD